MTRSRLIAAITAIVLAMALCCAIPIFADAEASAGGCQNDFGTKVPVLMVHGFNGGPEVWRQGSTSMVDAVNSVPGVFIVNLFDYHEYNKNWVTDPNIGSKLATTISCLAANSRQNGGTGKVIVVTHSMGGLALREAVSHTIDGRKVSDNIGYAIDIGTPQTGSPLASAGGWGLTQLCVSAVAGTGFSTTPCYHSKAIRAMMTGSRELTQLPEMPRTIPLRTIAGDVTTYRLWQTKGTDTKSDLVVKLSSATAEYTTDYPGDGKYVTTCTAEVFLWHVFKSSCWHGSLVGNPQVQGWVIQGISEYMRSLNPNPTPTLTGSSGAPTGSISSPPTSSSASR